MCVIESLFCPRRVFRRRYTFGDLSSIGYKKIEVCVGDLFWENYGRLEVRRIIGGRDIFYFLTLINTSRTQYLDLYPPPSSDLSSYRQVRCPV